MSILNKTKSLKAITIGELIPLSHVNDPVFSQKMMGDGVAFIPTCPRFYAPCDGEVTFVAETKHAIGIASKDGLDIIIHVGLDTVKLNGTGFTLHKQTGESVREGELLIELSEELFNNEEVDFTTPLIVSNYNELRKFDINNSGLIKRLDEKVIEYKK